MDNGAISVMTMVTLVMLKLMSHVIILVGVDTQAIPQVNMISEFDPDTVLVQTELSWHPTPHNWMQNEVPYVMIMRLE